MEKSFRFRTAILGGIFGILTIPVFVTGIINNDLDPSKLNSVICFGGLGVLSIIGWWKENTLISVFSVLWMIAWGGIHYLFFDLFS